MSSPHCIPRSRSPCQALVSSPENRQSRGRRGRLPSYFITATLSSLSHWLPRSLMCLTLYFLWPRSTYSRCHHRPRRSTCEQWRRVKAKLWSRSPLRRRLRASPTLRRQSTPSNHHRRAQGEHRTLIVNPSLTVALTPLSWRRRTKAVDLHLIERLLLPRTDLAPCAADWPGPPVSHSKLSFPPRRVRSGPARRFAAWLSQIRPGSFFFRNLFEICLDLWTCKIHTIFSMCLNWVIQISMCILLWYLSDGIGPMFVGPL
jgi:hypothetical protein